MKKYWRHLCIGLTGFIVGWLAISLDYSFIGWLVALVFQLALSDVSDEKEMLLALIQKDQIHINRYYNKYWDMVMKKPYCTFIIDDEINGIVISEPMENNQNINIGSVILLSYPQENTPYEILQFDGIKNNSPRFFIKTTN